MYDSLFLAGLAALSTAAGCLIARWLSKRKVEEVVSAPRESDPRLIALLKMFGDAYLEKLNSPEIEAYLEQLKEDGYTDVGIQCEIAVNGHPPKPTDLKKIDEKDLEILRDLGIEWNS